MYLAHMQAILLRRNSITRRLYRDDPSIMVGGVGEDGCVCARVCEYAYERAHVFGRGPAGAARPVTQRSSCAFPLPLPAPLAQGYDLINEPRCSSIETPTCPQLLTTWLREMAVAAAALAPRQLVTIGSEGFWAAAAAAAAAQQQQGNSTGARGGPGAWAAQQGQDFVAQASLPNISYAAIHL